MHHKCSQCARPLHLQAVTKQMRDRLVWTCSRPTAIDTDGVHAVMANLTALNIFARSLAVPSVDAHRGPQRLLFSSLSPLWTKTIFEGV